MVLKNSLNYHYPGIQHLHNAFNSQKIIGTMKIFLMALQSVVCTRIDGWLGQWPEQQWLGTPDLI